MQTAQGSARVAVFVDGSNFFYLQKDNLRWWVDPRKLLDWIKKRGEVVDANYYVGVDRTNMTQVSYIKALYHIGFSICEKPIKVIRRDDGTEFRQANLDVEITTDLLTTAQNYDEAVLVTGDADFLKPLRILRSMGKRFLILSTKNFIGQELRAFAGLHYQELSQLRAELEKAPPHSDVAA